MKKVKLYEINITEYFENPIEIDLFFSAHPWYNTDTNYKGTDDNGKYYDILPQYLTVVGFLKLITFNNGYETCFSLTSDYRHKEGYLIGEYPCIVEREKIMGLPIIYCPLLKKRIILALSENQNET